MILTAKISDRNCLYLGILWVGVIRMSIALSGFSVLLLEIPFESWAKQLIITG